MMRFFILLLFVTSLFASKVETFRWSGGESYLSFLEKNRLPLKSLYYDLDKDEQELAEEIKTGVHYQILKTDAGEITQLFIPINDELQIHIHKKRGEFVFEIIPIISETKTETLVLKIKNSPYLDIVNETGSKKLAQIFVSSFKKSLDFNNGLRKDDTLVMIYDQKYRLGKPFSMPILKSAMIEIKNKKHYMYLNEDGKYYNELGDETDEFLLARPIPNAKVSSLFTQRRFHPILNKYRAHLGVDYAATSGTPILAAGDGRVVFAGFMRGYGNVTKIQHENEYMTLYAHQTSFKKGIKQGVSVKKGQLIGYVGSTGLSTGPHLHFGLYKYAQAIDPLKIVQLATKKLSGKGKDVFLKIKKSSDTMIEKLLKESKRFVRISNFDTACYFNNKKCVAEPIQNQ